jgi:hypothetical protein
MAEANDCGFLKDKTKKLPSVRRFIMQRPAGATQVFKRRGHAPLQ